MALMASSFSLFLSVSSARDFMKATTWDFLMLPGREPNLQKNCLQKDSSHGSKQVSSMNLASKLESICPARFGSRCTSARIAEADS